ncbi:MAG: XdhC family protein [Cyclobacteriaceae bacterium]
MREIRHIIEAQRQAQDQRKKTVLATVVHVDGSSYRRPSARMLVDETGITTGAISGGCLEGDALRKALYALVQNKNTLITYDTSDEDDAVVGAQLGCNGIIQVLFEPVNPDSPVNPVSMLERAIDNRNPSILVTLFNLKTTSGPQTGTSLLLKNGEKVAGSIEEDHFADQILKDVEQVMKEETSLFREYVHEDVTENVFIEYFAPPISLVIVGAGNDTQVMARMAEVPGWSICVVDGRPTHATKDRFTPSCQVIVSKPEAILENITIDDRSAFVLMTHNYNYDLAVLKLLVDQPIPYVGILGPRKKFNRMLDDLKKDGVKLSESQLDKIYAPVGLEIGAETPEEISLSVLSEIQAVMTGMRGGFLREKKEPIHSRDNTQFDTIQI